jgi:uncharacterized protein (TIGR02145 family)
LLIKFYLLFLSNFFTLIYRTHMKNTLHLLSILIISMTLLLAQSCKKEDDTPPPDPTPTANPTVTDIDGNIYHTVTIGTQTWMVENLKVTHARNGDPIAHVTNAIQWSNLTSGAYCNYWDDGTLSDIYGRLYNWYAVAEGPVIAPAGWHIASDAEWQKLIDYLGGAAIAFGKLRETGTTHWTYTDASITNESGFTALPGGFRAYDGSYAFQGNACLWWSTTEADATTAWNRQSLGGTNIDRNDMDKRIGLSVRCIKD